eukprot:2384961-Rhodomonas_salina.1
MHTLRQPTPSCYAHAVSTHRSTQRNLLHTHALATFSRAKFPPEFSPRGTDYLLVCVKNFGAGVKLTARGL